MNIQRDAAIGPRNGDVIVYQQDGRASELRGSRLHDLGGIVAIRGVEVFRVGSRIVATGGSQTTVRGSVWRNPQPGGGSLFRAGIVTRQLQLTNEHQPRRTVQRGRRQQLLKHPCRVAMALLGSQGLRIGQRLGSAPVQLLLCSGGLPELLPAAIEHHGVVGRLARGMLRQTPRPVQRRLAFRFRQPRIASDCAA